MQSKTSSSLSMWSIWWVSLSLRHQHSTSRDSNTSLLCWSKPEPSFFKRSPSHCTNRRASSSTGTSLTQMRIRSFLYPVSERKPASRQNPGPVWYRQVSKFPSFQRLRQVWHRQVSKFSEAFVYACYCLSVPYGHRVKVAKFAAET